MRVLKIYLETTLFNYYLDSEREAHASTVKLFQEIAAGKYEAFTSIYVIDEIRKAPTDRRDALLDLITRYPIEVLDVSEEADRLADVYVAEGIIPARYRMDGEHIAIATINNIDMIVSLNFKHIVKRKTIEAAAVVNLREQYKPVRIYSPMEVIEDEE